MGPLTLGDVTMDLALKAHLSLQREVGEEAEVKEASSLVGVEVVLETLRLYVDSKNEELDLETLLTSKSSVDCQRPSDSPQCETDRQVLHPQPWVAEKMPTFIAP